MFEYNGLHGTHLLLNTPANFTHLPHVWGRSFCLLNWLWSLQIRSYAKFRIFIIFTPKLSPTTTPCPCGRHQCGVRVRGSAFFLGPFFFCSSFPTEAPRARPSPRSGAPPRSDCVAVDVSRYSHRNQIRDFLDPKN